MRKSYYDAYVERQVKISNFNLLKSMLINLGVVLSVVSLIIFGITQIADAQDKVIGIALPICIILTTICFVAIVPVNNKLRVLRAKRRVKAKGILVNN